MTEEVKREADDDLHALLLGIGWANVLNLLADSAKRRSDAARVAKDRRTRTGWEKIHRHLANACVTALKI